MYPIRLLRAFVRTMPKLMAEESMRAAEHVAMGSGSLDKKIARDVNERWAKAAQQHRAKGKMRPITGDGLASAGIGFRRVEAAP